MNLLLFYLASSFGAILVNDQASNSKDSFVEKGVWVHDRTWVVSLAFNNDGSLLASGGVDGSIRLWEVSSKRCIKTLNADGVHCLAFNPKANELTSGHDGGSIRIWSLDGDHPPRVLHGHDRLVTAVCYSSDGLLVASGSEDGTARVWNRSKDYEAKVAIKEELMIKSVAFCKDDKALLVAGQSKAITLCSLQSGGILARFQGHDDVVRSIAVSPSGKSFATASYDGTVRRWDLASLKETGCLNVCRERLWSVVYLGEDQIACTGTEGKVRLLSVLGKHDPQVAMSFEGPAHCLAYNPRAKYLAAGGLDSTIRLGAFEPSKPLQKP
jgi:WD40 repeat protein